MYEWWNILRNLCTSLLTHCSLLHFSTQICFCSFLHHWDVMLAMYCSEKASSSVVSQFCVCLQGRILLLKSKSNVLAGIIKIFTWKLCSSCLGFLLERVYLRMFESDVYCFNLSAFDVQEDQRSAKNTR